MYCSPLLLMKNVLRHVFEKKKKIRGNLFLNEFEINAVDVQKALPKMVLSYAAMIHLWK
jgi:hypothetical protein